MTGVALMAVPLFLDTASASADPNTDQLCSQNSDFGLGHTTCVNLVENNGHSTTIFVFLCKELQQQAPAAFNARFKNLGDCVSSVHREPTPSPSPSPAPSPSPSPSPTPSQSPSPSPSLTPSPSPVPTPTPSPSPVPTPTPSPLCTSPGQKLGNPGFETGSAAPWSTTPAVINSNGGGQTAHSGTHYAWLDGYGTTHTDTLSQSVTLPAGCHATLSFWLHVDTAETTTTTQFDKLMVKLGNTTLATFSNLNHISGYAQHTYDVSSFSGQTVTLTFTGTEDVSLQTSFVIDDTALTSS